MVFMKLVSVVNPGPVLGAKGAPAPLSQELQGSRAPGCVPRFARLSFWMRLTRKWLLWCVRSGHAAGPSVAQSLALWL